MFYTIYKITNKINKKIYIGAHKTSNLDDGYMGSGKILKRAIKKYGIENFEKEIIEVFENSEAMFDMEAKLVTKNFINVDTNYNLKEGGEGGFEYINSNKLNIHDNKHEKALKNMARATEIKLELLKTDKAFQKKFSENIKAGLAIYYANNDGHSSFKGKKHTDESKSKISERMKEIHKGENNPSFGSMWIHSLTEKKSKKIKKEELQSYEDLGWIQGRKMKFL